MLQAAGARQPEPPTIPALRAPELPSVDVPVTLLPELPTPPSVAAPSDVTGVVADVASDATSVISGATDLPSIPPPPPLLP